MPPPATRGMMAETKVSLAANQLSDQVKESMRFWRKFQKEYLKEVSSIKPYVGVDILQQVWRKKVEFSEDDQQFVVQRVKLRSCLDQVDEAIQLLTESRLSNNNDYDSRRHHLKKVRVTGNCVVDLVKSSETNEAACKDLLKELAELDKLIDLKSPTASMLHRLPNRPPLNVSRAEERNTDAFESSRREIGDADVLAEHNESSNWEGKNEQDNPKNWVEDDNHE